MKVHCLLDSWPWFGEHQCFTPFAREMAKQHPETSVVSTRYTAGDKIMGRVCSLCAGDWGRKNDVFAASEARFPSFWNKKIDPADIYHVLFFDCHFQYFRRWKKAPRNVIATIHHPIGREFPPGMEDCLRRLSSATVLWREGAGYFEKYVGKGRVKFIPYGVDTEFFKPGLRFQVPGSRNPANLKPDTFHLLFTGQNGRNLPMLKRVIPKLAERYKDICFDILVPAKIRLNELRNLAGHPRITWHENLSESAVRDLYQNSDALLMPMEDSGVNTAIGEALACGLPVVTTDVGGVRDYGGGSIYPVVPNDDDDAMVDLVGQYLAKPEWRDETGKKCREFAERELAWPIIAAKHLEVYKELCG